MCERKWIKIGKLYDGSCDKYIRFSQRRRERYSKSKRMLNKKKEKKISAKRKLYKSKEVKKDWKGNEERERERKDVKQG